MMHHDAVASERLTRLPPYLFAQLEKKQRQLQKKGKDVINLSIGDPDQPPSSMVIDVLIDSLNKPGIHQYSTTGGIDEFRSAVSEWMQKRYSVTLDTDKEILLAIGSKELIAHAPLALTNPHDVVLIPDPAYPVYRSGTTFALCEPYIMPLRKKNGFLPDIDEIPKDILNRTRLIFINYPNNPTGACATREFYKELINLAHKYGFLIISDAAYIELYHDDKPVSLLSISGAKDVAIEVHSMTKAFNMPGWRVAWAAGNEKIIQILRSFKANCDSGQFRGFQLAASHALKNGAGEVEKIRTIYRERRDIFVSGLRSVGWSAEYPEATFYVWFEVPSPKLSSIEFCDLVLQKTNVVMTPGAGFGRYGERFVRTALTCDKERLQQAVERLQNRCKKIR